MVEKLYAWLRGQMRKLVFGNVQAVQFAYKGENVSLSDDLIYSNESNISLGDGTVIGPHCVLYAAKAAITFGRNVMVSPNVTIITGEHRTDIIGEYMRNITNDMKLPQNDKPVVIEDDVWIGTNVTILKGVTIGRGSIVHAGAVVTKKIRPYTIYINEKLKVARFTPQEIAEHERILKEKYGVEYPPIVFNGNGNMFR